MAKQKVEPLQQGDQQTSRGNGEVVVRRLPVAACRRLVRLREAQGLTQKKMAERIGISVSYLNQIENGSKQPTVDLLLKKIGPGYGVPNPLDLLIERDVTEKPLVVMKKGAMLEVLRVGIDEKLAYEGLPEERVVGEHMSWCFARLNENFDSRTIDHPGEELIYVLEGKLDLKVGEEEVALEEGELAHYQSTLPHRLTSSASTPARVLLIRYPAH